MKKFIITALALAPLGASAQLSNVSSILTAIGNLIETALPILIALGLLSFFWGLVKFIFGGDDAKKEGSSFMIWGLVALFVMVSVWGLVRWIGVAVGVGQGDSISVPRVPGI